MFSLSRALRLRSIACRKKFKVTVFTDTSLNNDTLFHRKLKFLQPGVTQSTQIWDCKDGHSQQFCTVPEVQRIISILPPSKNGDKKVFVKEEASAGQVSFTFETGKLAKLASGAVVTSVGGTSVLVSAVSSAERGMTKDFLPLQVDYREKQYAAGKIPSTFMRREGAPKEREILCSRLIDRSIRPLFPKGFFSDTQIVASVVASDGEHDPDILAVNAASAALSLSSIPWKGPLGCVRVGRIGGSLVINPTMSELAESDLNLTYACTKDKTLMIETQSRGITNQDFEEALKLAHEEAVKLIAPQERLVVQVGLVKREVQSLAPPESVLAKVRSLALDAVSAVLSNPQYGKQDRGATLSHLESNISEMLLQEGDEVTRGALPLAMAEIKKEVVRSAVFQGRSRPDGRDLTAVRQLVCEAGLYHSLHGSALFSRGNTQVLCTVTLGPPDDAQRLDSLVGPTEKRFMVHYSFPGFSINEVKQERGGLNRREVGHGTLAEKALLAVLPEESQLPFSIRLTSDVLGSDGSSSMATVCGGSLALMDAGIPLREHVAGVSMGLMTLSDPASGEIRDYRLLTDILGLEDYLGDMDFKIAGTRGGITAVQLDIKPAGVPLSVLCQALEPARAARERILQEMERELGGPRTEKKENNPVTGTMELEKESIGRLIGPSGSTIKSIQSRTGARLAVSDAGVLTIFARDQSSYKAALDAIETTLGRDFEIGASYQGTVTNVKEFGAFLELERGGFGLLHISEIAHERVTRVEDHVKVGETLLVACIGRDLRGNIKLSRKALLLPKPKAYKPFPLEDGLRPVERMDASLSSSGASAYALGGGQVEAQGKTSVKGNE